MLAEVDVDGNVKMHTSDARKLVAVLYTLGMHCLGGAGHTGHMSKMPARVDA